jgi:hypothetical protein
MNRLLLTLTFALAANAEDTVVPRAEYTTGYIYFHWNNVNYSGVGGSVALNLNRWVGLVGDLSTAAGSEFGVHQRLTTYWGGPRLNIPVSKRVKPFAQFLLGGARYSDTGKFFDAGNAFAWTAGLAVDIRTSKHVSMRLFELDYVATYFEGGRQGFARASVGVVIH